MTVLKSMKIGSKGFTLVEIIVTIVVAGILGVIFMQLMGTALEASWNAVGIVRDESNGEGVMEQIIADYVANINSDEVEVDAGPDDVLDYIVNNYNGKTINGINITTQYIEFDGSGNESPGGSANLKIVLQASGQVSPAITGRYSMTTILATSRRDDDRVVLY
jgi:prepilin-type N-terminal cleavage/methylation domain-containing protein